MPAHLTIGRRGEKIAAAYVRKYCQVLHQNWKYGRKEIDIIACRNACIYFIEVKTRSSGTFGWPEEAVDSRKKENILAAADAYLSTYDLAPAMIRFDIIAITFQGAAYELAHFRDVF